LNDLDGGNQQGGGDDREHLAAGSVHGEVHDDNNNIIVTKYNKLYRSPAVVIKR